MLKVGVLRNYNYCKKNLGIISAPVWWECSNAFNICQTRQITALMRISGNMVK